MRQGFRTTFFTILVLFATHLILAQNFRYDVQFLDDKTGIGKKTVEDVEQDMIGRLWVATQQGLFVFNGINSIEFSTSAPASYQLPDNNVRCLELDERGHMWVCTDKGAVIFQAGTLSRVNAREYYNFPFPGFCDSIVAVCKGEPGVLLIKTYRAVYTFQNNEFKKIFQLPARALVNGFGISYNRREKRIFFSAGLGNMLAFDGSRVIDINYPVFIKGKKDNPKLSYLDRTIFTNLADTMFIVVSPGYILRHRKINGQDVYTGDDPAEFQKAFPPWAILPEFLSKEPEFSPSEYTSMTPWVMTRMRYDKHLFAIGTYYGIFLVKEKPILFHHIAQSRNKAVRGICEDSQHRLLAGAYSGLLDFGNLEKIHEHSDIPPAWGFYPIGRDSFWVTFETFQGLGLVHRTPNNDFKVSWPANSDTVSYSAGIIPVKDGFWTGYNRCALYRYNRFTGRLTPSPFNFAGCERKIDKAMLLSPRYGLWIGGPEGLANFKLNADGNFTGRTAADKLPASLSKTNINALYEDRTGTLWIGTTGSGLYAYSPQTGALKHWTNKEGLSRNTVYSIMGSNGDSVLWLGTQYGLCRMQVLQESFLVYFASDGLGQNEFNTGSRYRAADGTIYLGGTDGISYFHPEQIYPDEILQQVYALATISGADSKSREIILNGNDHLDVYYHDYMVEFSFRTNSLFKDDERLCRYKISSMDEEWRLIKLSEKLTLAGISAGNYTLEYQIKDTNGNWSALGLLQIKVWLPWYQERWFQALVLILMGSVSSLFYRWRMRELRKQFELRKSVSDDLHDTIGSRVFLLRSLASRIVTPVKGKIDGDLLKKFDRQSLEVYQIIRDFIWAFDPSQDKVCDLFDRLDDFAENYLTPIINDITITHPPVKDVVIIGPRIKHHLMNIYQELLTNMVKHTQSETIDISFGLEGKTLSFEIRNRHKGYRGWKPDQKNIQSGGESLQKRLAEINAKFVWEEPEEGLQIARIHADI